VPIYDYHLYFEDELDHWTEDPVQAMWIFFEFCVESPAITPEILRYPVGLNRAGERDTFTDRWDTLTWQQLVCDALPQLAQPGTNQ
jgi:hypothetical protein